MWCSKKKPMLEAGAAAPSVRLKTPEGKSWDLQEELRGGPVVLAFFKISCPTCQFTVPFLDRLAKTSEARIVLVSQDDAIGTRQFLDHFGVTLPVVLDELKVYPASNGFHITHVPSMFVVEADGVVSWALNGFHKTELERLASRFSVPMFLAEERVPLMRPG